MSTALLRAFESARAGNWSAVQQVCNEFAQRSAPAVRAADCQESSSESSGPEDGDDAAEDASAPTLEPAPHPTAPTNTTTSSTTASFALTANGHCAAFVPMQLDAEPPASSTAESELSIADPVTSPDGDASWTVVSRKQPRRPPTHPPR